MFECRLDRFQHKNKHKKEVMILKERVKEKNMTSYTSCQDILQTIVDDVFQTHEKSICCLLSS